MASKVVNLDALIPRADFAIGNLAGGTSDNTDHIKMSDLHDPFFAPTLRKPDFQRETSNWTPKKVHEFIKSFLDRDLIPAVILWNAGDYNFVIDGAHRLSALLAYINDDYGDRQRSIEYFKGNIPPEQEDIAQYTRGLINDDIGSYATLEQRGRARENLAEDVTARLNAIGQRKLMTQWVPASDAQAAEESFFKINQAATALDATEKIILRTRQTASSIAARAISKGGTGHAYWAHFDEKYRNQVPELAASIHSMLFEPPIRSGALAQQDAPIGGVGYNVLQMSFELVNRLNNVQRMRSNIAAAKIEEMADEDGRTTVEYLTKVKRDLSRLTGNSADSLGIHPYVYLYSRGGVYQVACLYAMLDLARKLTKNPFASRFRDIRLDFETYIKRHKSHISEIVHRYGSKEKSARPVREYFEKVIELLIQGEDVDNGLKSSPEWGYLFVSSPINKSQGKGSFSKSTKSAVFIRTTLENLIPCGICSGAIHAGSHVTDHLVRRSEGGPNTDDNGQLVHPVCNSLKG